jgi:NADH-quinone oxidoreductase subunit H
MDMLPIALYLLVFPGLLFLLLYSIFCEWVDRKLYARFQNRVGPPIYQPFADFIKLMAKDDITPEGVSGKVMAAVPIIAFAAAITAFMYIPIIGLTSLSSFQGDLIVVLYLLTIPTMALFFAGWYSKNLFGAVGAMRCMTQLFSYEVPLLLVLLGPAILAGSWSITDILNYHVAHPWIVLATQPLGLMVALVALQGKLERIPFDLPEAETEIVAGPLVEFTGRKLAIFRLVFDVEMVVVASLISVLFFGGFMPYGPVPAIVFFFVYTIIIVFILACLRSLFARIRIDQMAVFCWKYLAPLAIIQLLVIVLIKAYGSGWGWF